MRAMLASGVAAVVLSLAACSTDEPDQQADPLAGAASDAAGGAATEPLTGLRVAAGAHAVRSRPVLVVKMDNTPSSAPQLGLSAADLVVEELVEGGVTRLAAFYYSAIPDEVGPVRSMRASDLGIVSAEDATVVTSGAAAVTIKRIRGAGIRYVTEGSPGFFREPSRYAPYNLMARLGDVAAAVRQDPARPDDYLTFGPAAELPAGPRAATIDADFGSHTTSWTFDPTSGYVNDNTYAADGDEFPADTVLVLRVKVGDAGYRDPAGNPVPETRFEGRGAALLFHGGRVVKATWTKAGLDGRVELTTRDGSSLAVPAGHTWIELVPAATGDVTYAR